MRTNSGVSSLNIHSAERTQRKNCFVLTAATTFVKKKSCFGEKKQNQVLSRFFVLFFVVVSSQIHIFLKIGLFSQITKTFKKTLTATLQMLTQSN